MEEFTYDHLFYNPRENEKCAMLEGSRIRIVKGLSEYQPNDFYRDMKMGELKRHFPYTEFQQMPKSAWDLV